MKDGIYTNISIKDYHANRTHLSSTQIKIAKRSLKELDWTLRGLITQEEKSQFDFGNAFELALLDSAAFASQVAIFPDEKFCEAALKENPKLEKVRNSGPYQTASKEWHLGREEMYKINDKGKESWETIQHMLESCYRDKVIQGLIKNTDYQVSLFWTDEETGLKLKTRPDICKPQKNVLINVKTTLDGSPKGFTKDLVNYDYPIQAAMEITGCIESGLMESVDLYFWLVVEKVPPYNATVYELTKPDIDASLEELGHLKRKIAKARQESLFPGYSDKADNEHGILRAEIPLYYRMIV